MSKKFKRIFMQIFMCFVLLFGITNEYFAVYSESDSDVKISIEGYKVNDIPKYNLYTNEYASGYIKVDGSSLSKNVTGYYLELESPSQVAGKGEPLESDKFLDGFTVATDGLGEIKEVTQREENGKLIYRIDFNDLNSTSLISIPYVFSFRDGLVPENYEFSPIVRLYNGDNELISTATDGPYRPIYNKHIALKKINDSGKDGQIVFGGLSGPSDDNRIDPNRTEDISFYFTHYYTGLIQMRYIKEIEVIDTLPEYENRNGETVRARFEAEKNPGWEDLGNGKVRYIVRNKSEERYDTQQSLAKVKLLLSFPDLKTKEGDNYISYRNNVEFVEHPFNGNDEDTFSISDSINFSVTSDFYGGLGGILDKNSRPNQVSITYDKNGLYAEETAYTVSITNPKTVPLRNIVLTEDASKFDPRMYFIRADNFTRETDGSGHYLGNNDIIVRAYKSDGTYDELNYKDVYNKSAQDELKEQSRRVNSDELSPDETVPANVKYEKIELVFKDLELQPRENIFGYLYMGFRDPYHLEYSPNRDIGNTISLDANT